jgi:excisionase family DNA binding protein
VQANGRNERDALLDVDEVAEMLSVRRSSVYSLIRNRELEAIRVGHLWRVKASALTRFIQAGGTPR